MADNAKYHFLARSPKLIPFWVLWRLFWALRLRTTLSHLTSFMPATIWDVRKVEGMRFGLRLFRPMDYVHAYGVQEELFLPVRPKIDDVVLDIGANIGGYTLRYSRLVGERGRVIAFEPEPENRRILRWNIRLNNAKNVEVRPEAVGDFTGETKLMLSSLPGSHSLVRSRGVRPLGEIQVSVIRLDDLHLNRLDFAKIDVEGYELNVLRGAERSLTRLQPRLQVEVHVPHAQDCPVCTWLADKGFSVKILYERKGRVHWIVSN